VQAAKQRRLVLYLGAGISIGPPSCGPAGPVVADVLRPFVARMLKVDNAGLAGLGLEDLAQRVADDAGDRLDELRERASEAFDFCGMEPNFGHEAVALLLRERLAEAITVNWDCGIERAGVRADVLIEGVADTAQSIQLAQRLPLNKVHGCATRPSTLAVTQDEVDRPQSWAVGRTQGALAGGIVLFVGLGTIGLYVREPISELVEVWVAEAASFAIVDPCLPEAWRFALGEETAAENHLPRTGEAFFDELLRAIVRDAIDATEMTTRQLAASENWAHVMVAGFEALRKELETACADGVLRWWTDAVLDTGKPFITEARGQKCLMTAAQFAGVDGGVVEVAGVRGRQTVATSERYLEIACRPQERVGRIETVVRDRIQRRRAEGVYPKGKPVTVIVVDSIGEFPAPQAPPDIAAGDDDAMDIAGGADTVPIRFVSADDGVRGRLVAGAGQSSRASGMSKGCWPAPATSSATSSWRTCLRPSARALTRWSHASSSTVGTSSTSASSTCSRR
jgi:hypothetical protein